MEKRFQRFLFEHSQGCGTQPPGVCEAVRLKEKRGGEDCSNRIVCDGVRHEVGISLQ